MNDTTHNAEFMNWRLDTPSFIVTEEENKVSPLVAPNFCMLLRKHLLGGEFVLVVVFWNFKHQKCALGIEDFDAIKFSVISHR